VTLSHAVYLATRRVNALLALTSLHVGEYKLSARSEDFQGWLLCDGRSLDRVQHKALFDVIGTTFGSQNAQTFTLPDYRGRVIGQPGQGAGLSTRAMGAAVGSETHALTASEMPSHFHTGTVDSAGAHAHTASTAAAGAHTHGITDPGHAHTQTTINDDFNSSGSAPPGFAADSAGSRTWSNINTGVTINSAGDHTHAVTVASGGAHVHTFTTAAIGGGAAHANMQPTLFGANVYIYGGW
jgi:microcystin-dependent protein